MLILRNEDLLLVPTDWRPAKGGGEGREGGEKRRGGGEEKEEEEQKRERGKVRKSERGGTVRGHAGGEGDTIKKDGEGKERE